MSGSWKSRKYSEESLSDTNIFYMSNEPNKRNLGGYNKCAAKYIIVRGNLGYSHKIHIFKNHVSKRFWESWFAAESKLPQDTLLLNNDFLCLNILQQCH